MRVIIDDNKLQYDDNVSGVLLNYDKNEVTVVTNNGKHIVLKVSSMACVEVER